MNVNKEEANDGSSNNSRARDFHLSPIKQSSDYYCGIFFFNRDENGKAFCLFEIRLCCKLQVCVTWFCVDVDVQLNNELLGGLDGINYINVMSIRVKKAVPVGGFDKGIRFLTGKTENTISKVKKKIST